MYDIPYFKTSDNREVIAFMHEHPFIILCGADHQGRPVATHIPVLFAEKEGRLFLRAHAMRKQEHTDAFQENQQVLAIFYGPHTYVSASWYEDKTTASTWNYQAVHAKGILHFLGDDDLHDILVSLTEKFENNPHSPALVQKMSPEYVSKMMKAIIAFEIEIISVEHVFKLSQNRDEQSYQNIVQKLGDQDSDAKEIASLMKEKHEKLFNKNKPD